MSFKIRFGKPAVPGCSNRHQRTPDRITSETWDNFSSTAACSPPTLKGCRPSGRNRSPPGGTSSPAQGLTNSSIRRKLTVLRSLFSYLQTYGYVGANPAHSDFVAAPAAPRDGKTVGLTPEECRRLLDAPRPKHAAWHPRSCHARRAGLHRLPCRRDCPAKGRRLPAHRRAPRAASSRQRRQGTPRAAPSRSGRTAGTLA